MSSQNLDVAVIAVGINHWTDITRPWTEAMKLFSEKWGLEDAPWSVCR